MMAPPRVFSPRPARLIAPPAIALRPVIAVPARNEARRLPALIDALAAQSWPGRAGARLDVVLVIHNSLDGSARIAKAAAAAHKGLALTLLETRFALADAHVGSARRMAMQTACAKTGPGGVVMTTDADARPDPDWIAANLRAITHGADLVGGRLYCDASEEAVLGPAFQRRAAIHARHAALADQLTGLIDPLAHDPLPRHTDHSGASIAIRAEVYRAVGGLPALPVREDLALVARVRAAGYRVRHAPLARVQVSPRLRGRAPGGMADCLKTWLREEAENRPVRVEAVRAIETRARRRAALRDLADGDDAALATARALRIPISAFYENGARLNTAALIERLAPDRPDPHALEDADTAIAGLEIRIAALEGADRAA